VHAPQLLVSQRRAFSRLSQRFTDKVDHSSRDSAMASGLCRLILILIIPSSHRVASVASLL